MKLRKIIEDSVPKLLAVFDATELEHGSVKPGIRLILSETDDMKKAVAVCDGKTGETVGYISGEPAATLLALMKNGISLYAVREHAENRNDTLLGFELTVYYLKPKV